MSCTMISCESCLTGEIRGKIPSESCVGTCVKTNVGSSHRFLAVLQADVRSCQLHRRSPELKSAVSTVRNY
eukprot:1591627-Amphidinium_carterae.1